MIQTRWKQFYFLISSESVKVLVSQSCPTLCDPVNWLATRFFFCPWNSPGKNTGVGCHSLLQGIFPTQGLNPHLLRCGQILYHLSHQGSSRTKILLCYHYLYLLFYCSNLPWFFVVHPKERGDKSENPGREEERKKNTVFIQSLIILIVICLSKKDWNKVCIGNIHRAENHHLLELNELF